MENGRVVRRLGDGWMGGKKDRRIDEWIWTWEVELVDGWVMDRWVDC